MTGTAESGERDSSREPVPFWRFSPYPPTSAKNWVPLEWITAGWLLLVIWFMKLNGHVTSDVLMMGLVGLSNVEFTFRQWRKVDRARRGLPALADKLSIVPWLLLASVGAICVPTCVRVWREGDHWFLLGVSAVMATVGFLQTRRVGRGGCFLQ